MHIQHKYPLTSTPPFCHSIYINTLIGLEVEPGKFKYYLWFGKSGSWLSEGSKCSVPH